MKDFEVIEIEGRKIILKGIGKLFYQEGFPITMSIVECRNKGFEVSLLHVADEFLKVGWMPKTVINKLKNDAQEGIDNEYNTTDWDTIIKFCYSTYEDQREMIFQYLFGCTTNDVRSGKVDKSLEFLRAIEIKS